MTGRGKTRPEAAERHRDEGMTLVELMVTIGLATMLLGVVLSFTVVAIRTSDALEVRNDNLTAGQVGMAAASKVIRTAVLPDQLDDRACTGCDADSAIVQASRTQMSFYANLDNNGNGPSLVTLRVIDDPDRENSTMLRQTLVPPTVLSDGSYTFCDTATPSCNFYERVLVRGLPEAPAVFSYYDFDGAFINATTLTRTDLMRVASIDVELTVQLRPGQERVPAENLIQRITLPNADVNVLNEED